MNIFYLDQDPVLSAKMMCNKHMSKMIIETAQMLSTAHRMLDGNVFKRPSVSGKTKVSYYELPDWRENVLYKAVHYNHPCNVWIRETTSNYDWLYQHFLGLGEEYTERYGRTHETMIKLGEPLIHKPNNLKEGNITPPALAMKSNPECIIPGDPVKSYRNFYITKQERFNMVWPDGKEPSWFVRIGERKLESAI